MGLLAEGAVTARTELTRLENASELGVLDADLAAAASVGIDRVDIAPLRAQLPLLRQAQQRALHGGDVFRLAARIQALLDQTNALESRQRAENALVQRQAQALLVRYAGRPDALRQAGREALASGRNDATVATFLGIAPLRIETLERYGAMIDAGKPDRAALGVAGVLRSSELIHKTLLARAPGKVILVSVAAQRLDAFDHGRLLLETLVTTGRPSLPTDVGRMQVVKKDSPWTMQSPWPKGSPYWYPDTPVRMVLWFTRTGEGIHDAAWEPASAYGPGSTAGPFASHGCIHVPLDAVTVLYPWAPLGTPVVVYPGDGSPVAAQVAQRSVDARGNPESNQPSGI